MPPKAKFTREEIITSALQIVRENGIAAVTARELGERLGSSARPIFTVFENMEEVHEQIKTEAKAIYRQYVEKGLGQKAAFKGVGIAYIQFAIREPKLFQLLFMNEQEPENDVEHTLMLLDDNYEKILQSVEDEYQLEREKAKRLYRHLWIYTHGIASLCATNVCHFSAEEIESLLTEVFGGLLEKI